MEPNWMSTVRHAPNYSKLTMSPCAPRTRTSSCAFSNNIENYQPILLTATHVRHSVHDYLLPPPLSNITISHDFRPGRRPRLLSSLLKVTYDHLDTLERRNKGYFPRIFSRYYRRLLHSRAPQTCCETQL